MNIGFLVGRVCVCVVCVFTWFGFSTSKIKAHCILTAEFESGGTLPIVLFSVPYLGAVSSLRHFQEYFCICLMKVSPSGSEFIFLGVHLAY